MNNSAKGARLERLIAQRLALAGWSVVRGASSKSYGQGKIDLVCINPKKRQIVLMQVKNFKSPYHGSGSNQIGELWNIFNFNADTKTPIYTMNCKLATAYDYEDILKEMIEV